MAKNIFIKVEIFPVLCYTNSRKAVSICEKNKTKTLCF